jgi:hypothetical protein
MTWEEYVCRMTPEEFAEWITTGDTEYKKKLFRFKPPAAPSAPMPVQQAQSLVSKIQQQLAEDLRQRLAMADTGRINWSNPGTPQTKEEQEAAAQREAERRERQRHVLR